ncbi:superfamily I DNA helicase [Salmonella enterica subsp. enterica]|uniref:Superfamily I DNA helicase n=1 Tax=Salmonella enterica I TaxID=59201 RepID=A0A379X161_SALET|nr:superfamily I DNA helicase [Salmonella enterica subsp. enterica]
MPKRGILIGEIGQYDKYKTTHTSFSINFDDSVDRTAETDENEKHDMQPGSRIGVNIWMIQRSY